MKILKIHLDIDYELDKNEDPGGAEQGLIDYIYEQYGVQLVSRTSDSELID